MQNYICVLATGIFLIIASIADIKTGYIPLPLILGFGAMGAATCLYYDDSPTKLLLGLTTGTCILALGVLSEWQVGGGDGLSLMVIGLFLGPVPTVRILIYGLFICGVFGGILIMVSKGMYSRKSRLPFLPFLTLGFVLDTVIIIIGA